MILGQLLTLAVVASGPAPKGAAVPYSGYMPIIEVVNVQANNLNVIVKADHTGTLGIEKIKVEVSNNPIGANDTPMTHSIPNSGISPSNTLVEVGSFSFSRHAVQWPHCDIPMNPTAALGLYFRPVGYDYRGTVITTIASSMTPVAVPIGLPGLMNMTNARRR